MLSLLKKIVLTLMLTIPLTLVLFSITFTIIFPISYDFFVTPLTLLEVEDTQCKTLQLKDPPISPNVNCPKIYQPMAKVLKSPTIAITLSSLLISFTISTIILDYFRKQKNSIN